LLLLLLVSVACAAPPDGSESHRLTSIDGESEDDGGYSDCPKGGCPYCEDAEVCGGGEDADCDGLIDCEDPDCADEAQCVMECVWEEQVCPIPDCNFHRGDDREECLAAGNTGGCTDEELEAWCTRRVEPGADGLWYRIHREWVEERCPGEVTFTDHEGRGRYACRDSVACIAFECITPIVVVFEGESWRVEMGPGAFDLLADGSGTRTGWPAAETPWLVRDLDGDGAVTSGAELFGSATPLTDGTPATNGFEALRELDADGDLALEDDELAELALWFDHDADRETDEGELVSLTDAGFTRLSVDDHEDRECDAAGNCAIERAAATWTDGMGSTHGAELVDVHLRVL
jgi:hypothetical protein